MTTRDRVLAALTDSSLSTDGITTALAITNQSARRALAALLEAGHIQICGSVPANPGATHRGGRRGYIYGVTPAGRAALASRFGGKLAACEHKDFAAHVRIDRVEDTGKYFAGLSIACRQCGLPFEFVGMAPGMSMSQPMVSVDGTEARMPISPKGARPNPLQQMQHGLSRFNS